MRLGGPVFNAPQDPEELARAHRSLGYGAAYCPEVDISDTQRIKDIRKAFAAEDVVIAETGAWCNIIAAENDKREKNIDYVCRQLALADEVDALCCVDYVGTFEPGKDWGPHPDNMGQKGFDVTVEVTRKIIDAVKPTKAKFTLEMMQWVYPWNADSYIEIIEAVDREAFAVHLDPVNTITSPELYFDTGYVVRECFEKLGKWIVSCHAKDIIARGDLSLHLDETPPGTGNMDYRTYLEELNKLPGNVPLMLEHLETEEQYTAAREYILSV
jgi:sugar phosphate isomerase/epimerase